MSRRKSPIQHKHFFKPLFSFILLLIVKLGGQEPQPLLTTYTSSSATLGSERQFIPLRSLSPSSE